MPFNEAIRGPKALGFTQGHALVVTHKLVMVSVFTAKRLRKIALGCRAATTQGHGVLADWRTPRGGRSDFRVRLPFSNVPSHGKTTVRVHAAGQ
jgi:hypothetical protein